MFRAVNLVLVGLLLILDRSEVNSCATGKQGGDISFTVASHRNSSGHRHVKADISVPDGVEGQPINSRDVFVKVTMRKNIIEGVSHQCITASFTMPETRQGPAGYELAPGIGWYRLHLQPLTWEEAKAACEGEGAHLAVLNSQQEAEVLKAIFAKAPDVILNATYNTRAFVGFSDVVEGNYVTIFGETLRQAGYEAWHPGQPDNMNASMDSDSDCGSIERRTGLLNDLQCRSKNAYFCEYPL